MKKSARKLLNVVRHPRLCAALDEYFAVKAAGKGVFPADGTRDRICNNILAEARRLRLHCEIVPGAIVLTTKQRIAWVTMRPYEPSKWEATLDI